MAILDNLRVSKGVALHDVKVGRPMEEEIHLGDGRIGYILFLAE